MSEKNIITITMEHFKTLQKAYEVLNDKIDPEEISSLVPEDVANQDKTNVFNIFNCSVRTKMIGNKLKKFFAISIDNIEEFDQLYIYDNKGKIKPAAVREMVIVIVDIIDSTKIMEKDGMLRAVRKYDALLDGLIDNSELFNPVLIKPTGDGILILFDVADIYLAATFGVSTIMTVKGLVENELNVRQSEAFGDLREDIKIDIAVGITCGEVVYGIFGQNYLHYLDALGPPINLSARLQAETRKYKNTNILFDEEFVNKATPVLPNVFFRRKLLPVKYLKGLEKKEIFIYDTPEGITKDDLDNYCLGIQLVGHLERRDIKNIKTLISSFTTGLGDYSNFTETKKTVKEHFLKKYFVPRLFKTFGKEDDFNRELITRLLELIKTE